MILEVDQKEKSVISAPQILLFFSFFLLLYRTYTYKSNKSDTFRHSRINVQALTQTMAIHVFSKLTDWKQQIQFVTYLLEKLRQMIYWAMGHCKNFQKIFDLKCEL